jgi:hypothetical protein
MRLFEALVIVVTGQIVLAGAVMGGHWPRWTNLLPLACLAPLAAHLAIGGYRWQMIPAYLVIAVLCPSGVYRYARSPRHGQRARERRGLWLLLGIAGFLLLLASVAAAIVT